MRRLRAVLAVLVVSVIVGHLAARAAVGAPYEILGRWVDAGETLQPRVGDFAFTDVGFASPTEGWIVGDRFLLHLVDGSVRVVFVDDFRTSLTTVAVLGVASAWAGGLRTADDGDRVEGVLWKYGADGWRPVPLPRASLVDWTVGRVRFANPRDGWALVHGHAPAALERRDALLHFDGTSWVVAWEAPARSELSDICVSPDGGGWVVGRTMVPGARTWAGAAWRRVADSWSEVPVRLDREGDWGLHRARCLGGGRVVAIGGRTTSTATGTVVEGVLVRFDDLWQRMVLPDDIRAAYPDAVDVDPEGHLWLAVGNVIREHVRREDTSGGWGATKSAVLPDGRERGYAVVGLAMTSASEGWAIANDTGGPGVVRGLVLRYRAGTWSNRGWTWPFWRERWFGLFGH